jgi:hypothetical protein
LVERHFAEFEHGFDHRFADKHGFWRTAIRKIVYRCLDCGDRRLLSWPYEIGKDILICDEGISFQKFSECFTGILRVQESEYLAGDKSTKETKAKMRAMVCARIKSAYLLKAGE